MKYFMDTHDKIKGSFPPGELTEEQFFAQFDARAAAGEDNCICKEIVGRTVGWQIQRNDNRLAPRKAHCIQNNFGKLAILYVGRPDFDIHKIDRGSR